MHKRMNGLRGIAIAGVIVSMTTIGTFADFGDKVLKKNMVYQDVQPVKYMLGELGYYNMKNNKLDATYDEALEQAVKWFQSDYQLKTDGIIGDETMRYIMSVYNNIDVLVGGIDYTKLKRGMEADGVATLKRALVYLEIMNDDTIIDDNYDEALSAGVTAFQQKYGIKADGLVGSDTLKILQAAIKYQVILKNGGVPEEIDAEAILNPAPAAAEEEVANDIPGSANNGRSVQSKGAKGGNPPISGNAGSIVATGQQLLGVPYVYGGTSPRGVDCSGFTTWTFKQMGVSLPRTATAQFGVGQSVSRENLQPGDLVFFKTGSKPIGHVGIYAGNDKLMHASSSKGRVVTVSFSNYIKYVTYVGARRIM